MLMSSDFLLFAHVSFKPLEMHFQDTDYDKANRNTVYYIENFVHVCSFCLLK